LFSFHLLAKVSLALVLQKLATQSMLSEPQTELQSTPTALILHQRTSVRAASQRLAQSVPAHGKRQTLESHMAVPELQQLAMREPILPLVALKALVFLLQFFRELLLLQSVTAQILRTQFSTVLALET
jgi:hypothetical protein